MTSDHYSVAQPHTVWEGVRFPPVDRCDYQIPSPEMSLPTENAVRKAPANMETESKAVGKQPTAVPDMSPAQQPAKKAGRLRGGCIPCPVRSSFAFSLRFGLRSVHPVLPLHPHTLLLHLTSRRPARASGVPITCNLPMTPPLYFLSFVSFSVFQTCTPANCISLLVPVTRSFRWVVVQLLLSSGFLP